MSPPAFFCENHEKRRKGKRKEVSGKKKAFAFFHIKTLCSFFPLLSFAPQKSADLPHIFMSGLQTKSSRGKLLRNPPCLRYHLTNAYEIS